VIGILVTLISVLVAGIFFVVFRGQRGRGKETPTRHTLIATKIQDRLAASIDFKVRATSFSRSIPLKYLFPPDERGGLSMAYIGGSSDRRKLYPLSDIAVLLLEHLYIGLA